MDRGRVVDEGKVGGARSGRTLHEGGMGTCPRTRVYLWTIDEPAVTTLS